MFSSAAGSSSAFSCLSCGIVEEMSLDLKRQSSSRRSVKLTSPAPRSRSTERYSETKTEVIRGNDSIDGDYDYENNDDDDGILAPEPVKPSSNRGRHVRAMSDPLDAQEELIFEAGQVMATYAWEGSSEPTTTPAKESLTGDLTPAQIRSSRRQSIHASLPTLPRFPVIATKNKNCWSEPPVTIFQVRGPDYAQSKAKVASGPYLLTARGCDIFLAGADAPHLHDKTRSVLAGQLRRLPSLVVNFRFPWGVMALYFEIPTRLVQFMLPSSSTVDDDKTVHSLSAPERLLANWLQGDAAYRNDRLKLIPFVAEGPWVVRNMVTGRPAIIGKKLPVTYQLLNDGSSSSSSSSSLQPVLIATLDIGNSSAAAKRIVSVCRRYMSALTVDIGFVLQGDKPEELPEQMLGSVRVHAADPLQAPSLQA